MAEGDVLYAYPSTVTVPYADDVQPFTGTEVFPVGQLWYDLRTKTFQIGDSETEQSDLGRFVAWEDGVMEYTTSDPNDGALRFVNNGTSSSITFRGHSDWNNPYMALLYLAGFFNPGLYLGDPTADTAFDTMMYRESAGKFKLLGPANGPGMITNVADATTGLDVLSRAYADTRYLQTALQAEAIQDVVGAMATAGTGITPVYDDPSGLLTLNLATIAANRILGSVAGGIPGALTGTQVGGMIRPNELLDANGTITWTQLLNLGGTVPGLNLYATNAAYGTLGLAPTALGPLLTMKANSGYTNVAMSFAPLLGISLGNPAADVATSWNLAWSATGIATIGANYLRSTAMPANDSDFTRRLYIDGRTVRTITAATDTLVLADSNQAILQFNRATAITETVPLNAAVAFPVGTAIPYHNIGAGAVTLSVSGLTFTGSLVIPQYGGGWLYKTATNTWANVPSNLPVNLYPTPTGSLAMGSQKITGLAPGTAATDCTDVDQMSGANLVTGRWMAAEHTTRTTLACTQNRGYIGRIRIRRPVTFTEVCVEVVTTAAGAGGEVIVYLHDDLNGVPNNLIWTSSAIAVTATGKQGVTGQSLSVVTPGEYHLAVAYRGSATVPTLRATAAACLSYALNGSDPTGATPTMGYRSASDNVSGAPASTWAGSTSISTIPLVWLKP